MADDLEGAARLLLEATFQDLLRKVQGGEATASDLNVARQLLKDNGIELQVAKNDAASALLARIKTEDEEEAHQYGPN